MLNYFNIINLILSETKFSYICPHETIPCPIIVFTSFLPGAV